MTIAWFVLSATLAVAPSPREVRAGLLFHVSFDKDRKADFAVGDPLATQSRSGPADFTAGGGQFIPGAFGQALTGRGSYGFYDARANFNPRHGTVAFFLKQKNKPYGFEPLVVSSVDDAYWLRYLRLETKPKGVLVTSFTNEIYRPRTTGGAEGVLKEDVWQHIAIAWDEARGFVTYVDGEICSSMWDKHTWLAHGVDADSFWLRPDADVAYDELYVFDRPLSQAQIRVLMRENNAPPPEAMAPVVWDEVQQRNRLKELSWAKEDPAMPHVLPGEPLVAHQVVPRRARAVLGECNAAFDGKLGDGFPGLYSYSYARGNGLHVELPEPPESVDYAMIEGNFSGNVYAERFLLEDGKTPLATIRSGQFLHRWKLDKPHAGPTLSFFRFTPENLADAPDKEQLITGRINELTFFRLSHEQPRLTSLLRQEISATKPVPALQYQKYEFPAADRERTLSALRLVLHSADKQANALRIELHDPLLPARRLVAFDCAITGDADVTLDLSDRIVPAGSPVTVTLCFKRDVKFGPDSRIEWLAGDRDKAIDEHIAADMPLILSRFALLASPRPWGAVAVPEQELPQHYKLAGELFKPLMLVRELRPQHSTANALWAWTHKDAVDTSPVEVKGEGPRWALLQRELARQCRGVFSWWIDNRQVPSGEFGDDLNDDTDFMQDMPRYAMLHDPGRKLANAATGVADACVNLGSITKGVSTLATDPLHAYENGTNILAVAAMLHYGDPARLTPLMEAHCFIEDRFTALDVHGRRRFRSMHLGYNEIHEQGDEGADAFGNVLFAHPALFLAYYSHNPRAMKFVTDYADGWIGYWNDAAKDKANAGKIPQWTKLDGTITRWDHRVRGWGFSSLFVGALSLTGQQRYRDAAFLWIDPANGRFKGSDVIATLEAVDYKQYAKQLAQWADEADLTHVTADQFGQIARQRYLKFEATGDEQAAYDALEASLRNIRLLFDAYTLGEPQNDRIWPPEMVVSMMALGESPHERNQLYPRHYVSYEGFSDLAAWVRRKSNTSLTVWLYSFAAAPEQGVVRVWRTPAGTYTATFDGISTQATLHRGAGIPVTLQPGKVQELVIDAVKLDPKDEAAFWQRADAAVSPSHVTRDGNTIKAIIHNLGNAPLTNLQVVLVDGVGKTVATQFIECIEAPVDLQPRFVEVTFKDVPTAAQRLVLNPDGAILELYDLNNAADLPERPN